MIKHRLLRLRLALAAVLIGALTYSFIPLRQDGGQNDYFSSALTSLVGKKVKVVSFEGKRIQGTLWNFNDEFLSVKVKKGLVYSKTETIEISEVDYIEDPDGRKISMLELEALSQIETAKQTGGGPSSKSTLYFHTDDILGSNSQKSTKTDRALSNKESEKKRQFSSGLARGSSTPKKSYKSQTATRPTRSKVTKRRPTRPRVASTARSRRPKSSSTRSSGVAKRTEKNPPAALAANTDKDQSVELSETAAPKTAAAVAASRLRALQQSAAFIRTETVAGQNKKLRYQNFILFGVVGIAFGVLMMAKVREANYAVAGDASLFPAAVVKMNGRFGLINQGLVDGIKLGDVIKLYRKEGRHVDFKGKGYVRKVSEKFSLVEAVKTKKLQYLEIGDTGFVDRSFSANIVRGFRRATGTALQGLASGLGQAANNVEGKVETPDSPKMVESDQMHKPVAVQPKVVTPRPRPTPVQPKVVTPRPQLVPVQPKTVPPRPQPVVRSPRPTHPQQQPRVTVVDHPVPRPQPNVAMAGHRAPQPKVTVVDSPAPRLQPVFAAADHTVQPSESNVTVVDRAVPQQHPKVTIVDHPIPQSQPQLTIANHPHKPKAAPVGFGLEHL
jgi:hypothetical protein